MYSFILLSSFNLLLTHFISPISRSLIKFEGLSVQCIEVCGESSMVSVVN